jgi:tRNA threonylcarbamoyladenosine biosynthesis protein TsaE
MGSPDTVTSPTFTLANQYVSHKLTLHHFDFYRLKDPGIMQYELREVIDDPFAVVVVEWPEIMSDVFNVPHPIISLRHIGETERDIDVQSPDQYAYLFKDQVQ